MATAVMPAKRTWSLAAGLAMFAVATVGEFAALTGWFVLHQENPGIASSFYDSADALVRWFRADAGGSPVWSGVGDFLQTPHPYLAVAVLWAGFLVERSMVVLWLDVARRVFTPAGHLRPRWVVIGGVTAAEIVVWLSWIALAKGGEPALAAVVLFAGIHAVHAYEVAVLKHRPLSSELKQPGVITITVLESVGGVWALWLAMQGRILLPLVVIGLALLIEHTLQVLGLRAGAEFGV